MNGLWTMDGRVLGSTTTAVSTRIFDQLTNDYFSNGYWRVPWTDLSLSIATTQADRGGSVKQHSSRPRHNSSLDLLACSHDMNNTTQRDTQSRGLSLVEYLTPDIPSSTIGHYKHDALITDGVINRIIKWRSKYWMSQKLKLPSKNLTDSNWYARVVSPYRKMSFPRKLIHRGSSQRSNCVHDFVRYWPVVRGGSAPTIDMRPPGTVAVGRAYPYSNSLS